ncbi:MAG TPA: hypothetical protein VM914_04065 [Pyrinomonadaceae bacterium]|nr:hypothetical protein [Pyrinomonadaceae bacterium]
MKRFVFPREVLLVEVERRCGEPVCGARVKLSLTKAQARAYTGFECERCARWYADALSERDIPEWWEEINVASLRGPAPARESPKSKSESAPEREGAPRALRPSPKEAPKRWRKLPRAVEEEEVEEPEAVMRLSEEWRRLGRERESSPEVAEDERGDSF